MNTLLDLIFNQWTFFLGTPFTTIGAFLLLRHKLSWHNWLALLMFVLSSLLFFVAGDFGWSARDGWGADARESFGSEAVTRFWVKTGPAIPLALALLIGGMLLCKRRTAN